ncbi:universal stress protein [Zobellia russellii]|uniref:universal stress protein n=1 Tax=Zobellia russellii TaxID=248907 RepID=UPI0037DCB2B8
MEKDKNRIVLFSSLGNSLHNLLKSSVSLAKMVDGELEVFHVRKPIDIIRKDNQLSAMRTINREYILTDKRMKRIVSPISEDYGVPISYSSAFGNVKTEIARYLANNNPDIIVLGRRKARLFRAVDDRIANFVLTIFKGSVMIVSEENGLEPDMKIGIGTLNCSSESSSSSFLETLFAFTDRPLKSFNIVEGPNIRPKPQEFLGQKTVEYVFDYNENTLKQLPTYLSNSNINLLFVERKKKESKATASALNMYNKVKKLGITLMIAGEKRLHIKHQSNLRIA